MTAALFLAHNAYFILIPLAILEGPFLAIVCGIAVDFGYLNPFLAWGILLFGDFLPDTMYYWIGRYGTTLPWVLRTAERTKLLRENLLVLDELWKTKLFTTLASAKLAYGIAPPLIVTAGLSRIPYLRFITYSLAISSMYFAFLVSLGYIFARIYDIVGVSTTLAKSLFGLGAFFFFLLLLLLMWQTRRELLRQGRPREDTLFAVNEAEPQPTD